MSDGAEAQSVPAISVSAACVRENRRGLRKFCPLAVPMKTNLLSAFLGVPLRPKLYFQGCH
jgi:hypothetical protein